MQTSRTQWSGDKGLLRGDWDGLATSFCNKFTALSSLDPSPALCGEEVFGSDFGLSSSKILGSISQVGTIKLYTCWLQQASPGIKGKFSLRQQFSDECKLYSWILVSIRQNTKFFPVFFCLPSFCNCIFSSKYCEYITQSPLLCSFPIPQIGIHIK